MAADLWTEHIEDEIRESVDDSRLLIEVRGRIDHPEHPHPTRDPIERAEFSMEGAEHRQCGEARRCDSLVKRHFSSNLAERRSHGAICRLRSVTRNNNPVTLDIHEGERKHNAWWGLDLGWQCQPEMGEPFFDMTHRRFLCAQVNFAPNLSDAPDSIGFPWPKTAASKSKLESLVRLAFPSGTSS